MDPFITGSLISTAGGLLGGIFGSNANKKAVKSANDSNEKLQREFAQNSIQWKTKDAKAAGLHPLAALGAQGYSPTIGAMAATPGDSISQSLSDAGAAIGNAVSNKRTQSLNEKLLQSQIATQDALAHKYRSEAMETDFAMLSAAASDIGRSQSPGTLGVAPQVLELAGGDKIKTIPTRTPGQDLGDRYGDIAGEVGGMALGVEEVIIPAIKEWWQKDIMNGVKEFQRQYEKGTNRGAPLPKNYQRY